MELTPLQRKVLALYKKALAQEQKGLESCAKLARFAGRDFGLKVAIERHQSNYHDVQEVDCECGEMRM